MQIPIPGKATLHLEHLVLDVNGTIADRGVLLPGAADRLGRLAGHLELHVVSADTHGTAHAIADDLGSHFQRVIDGDEKRRYVQELGARTVAAVGNGTNDAAMLASAVLGIAVLGAEGTSHFAIRSADVVCPSIDVAIDLLLEPTLLAGTLRA